MPQSFSGLRLHENAQVSTCLGRLLTLPGCLSKLTQASEEIALPGVQKTHGSIAASASIVHFAQMRCAAGLSRNKLPDFAYLG